MPAPLVATADTNPRSIKSTITGDRPVFNTCAPRPQMMARPARLAASSACTTALKSLTASNDGNPSKNPATPVPFL